MNRLALPLLAIMAVAAAAPGAARADAIEQSFTYDWTSADPQHHFSFDPFDDLGGARQLTAVTLGFSGTISMEITAQTWGDQFLPAGSWSAEASHTVVAYFNDGGDGRLDLLQGIGGQWADGITGDLAPGAPGLPYVFTHTISFANVVTIDSAYHADFAGSEPLVGFMDGFFDGVVTPPGNGQWVDLYASLVSQQGTVTLTYEFTAVPEPTGLAALGTGGLFLLARRRR